MTATAPAVAARRLLGRDAAVVASAPGRVNLVGEHTDYNDGFVLPFAIEQRCAVAVAPRDDEVVVVRSTGADGAVRFGVDTVPGDVGGWGAYVAGVVWSLREAGVALGGCELAIASDVWLGAGLSSSAALAAAVGVALGGDEVGPTGDDRAALVRVLQRAENEYVGAPTGILDQSASLRCRPDHLLLLDCRSDEAEHVPVDLAGWDLTVLVVDSGAQHSHVDGEYATRRAQCEAAAEALGVPALRDATADLVASAELEDVLRRRARHVVTEDRRVLDVVAHLRDRGDPRRIGPLLTASHASLRDDYEVTEPRVDLLVETALAAGAHGARMTGGGFGGCVLALVDTGDVASVVEAIARAWGERGLVAPRHLVATPSSGARVELVATGEH